MAIYVPKAIVSKQFGFSIVPVQVTFLAPTGKSNELCNKNTLWHKLQQSATCCFQITAVKYTVFVQQLLL